MGDIYHEWVTGENDKKIEQWIVHTHNGIGYLECPRCSVWFLWMHLTRNSYCPNCGKRLEVQHEK